MSYRIFKYPIPADGPTSLVTIQLPVGCQILTINQQNNGLFLWAKVDPTQQAMEDVQFLIVGTGEEITQTGILTHLGTVLMYTGAVVVHVFQVTQN